MAAKTQSKTQQPAAGVSTLAKGSSESAPIAKDPYLLAFQGVMRSLDHVLLGLGSSGNLSHMYEDLERDPKVFEALQKRKLAVVNRQWQIDPVVPGAEGDKAAAALTEEIKNLPFDRIREELMDGLCKGFAVSEIVFKGTDAGVAIDRIVQRAQRRFVFKDVPGEPRPELRLLTAGNMLEGEELPQYKFIVHTVGQRDGNPYGIGLGRQLYWPVFFKRQSLTFWLNFADKFATPTPFGKYPSGTSIENQHRFLQALVAMGRDGALVAETGSEIEMLQANPSGGAFFKELLDFLNAEIVGVVLGEAGGQGHGGAMAAAALDRRDVRLELVKADAALLDDTLNDSLIKVMCQLRGHPDLRLKTLVKEPVDTKALADTYQVVYNMGFEPSLDDIKEKFGDGWTKRVAPVPAASPAPAPASQVAEPKPPAVAFAEAAHTDTQDTQAQLQVADYIGGLDLADLSAGMVASVLAAAQAAPTLAAFKARLPSLLGELDTVPLQQALEVGYLGAKAVGLRSQKA